MRLALKGIATAEDAEIAAELGVAAVWVRRRRREQERDKRDRQRDRETETEIHRKTEKEAETERETERQSEKRESVAGAAGEQPRRPPARCGPGLFRGPASHGP